MKLILVTSLFLAVFICMILANEVKGKKNGSAHKKGKYRFTFHQYIKEYKVGYGAKKRDHFARAVFVLIIWEGGR